VARNPARLPRGKPNEQHPHTFFRIFWHATETRAENRHSALAMKINLVL